MNSVRWILMAGAFFALLSVAIGAFSAHALKAVLDQYSLGIFETAARYQMYHALALLICGLLLLSKSVANIWAVRSAKSFVFGIFLFSGSLYSLALTGIKWLGAITPVGGIGFLLGWCFLIVAVFKGKELKE
jgi:uncharacterized membrane protein YgdD (TMEM256/DUF423 family)